MSAHTFLHNCQDYFLSGFFFLVFLNVCRQTSFYCTLLYCALWYYFFFFKLRFVGDPESWNLLEPFSNSICSLYVAVSHFGNSCNISNFIITTCVIVILDLWCCYCKKIMTPWGLKWWGPFFSNKAFFRLRYVHCFLDIMLLHT